jgi:hypothetical protein
VFNPLVHYLAKKLGDDGDGDSDSGCFAGSLLDWSVNYSQGAAGSQREAAREIARIQAKAELLDDREHERGREQ